MKFKTLKFIGPYGELKKHGYVFQRLYAHNYMQWCREASAGKTVRVWKRGNEVEVNDFFHNSAAVAEYVRDHDPQTFPSVFGGTYQEWHLAINQKTGEVEPHVYEKHDHIPYIMRDRDDDMWERVTDECKAAMIPDMTSEEHRKTYREAIVTVEQGDVIRELFELGWVEVVEEEL
jgi:hypothetical protein